MKMEELFRYEEREQLYDFLIKDFGFAKLEERYDPKAFGNYYIVLFSSDFLVRYIQDRSFLTIEIASHSDSDNWYDLSIVKNFIYNPDNINPANPSTDAVKRIEELNNFLKNDYQLIRSLFSKENYENTRKNIDELVRQQFNQKFPGMLQ